MPSEQPAARGPVDDPAATRTSRRRQAREVAELIERIRSGTDTEESFRRLFARYYRLVKRYFADRGMDPGDSEDLTQETFVAVYRGLPGFSGDGPFDAWLFTIARRTFAGSVRRAIARRRQLTVVPMEDAGDTPLDRRATEPLGEAIDREQRRQLHRAIGRMPEQMRRCAALRLIHELKYREIAEVLGISEDAVRVQLARARKRLRRELSGTPDEVLE